MASKKAPSGEEKWKSVLMDHKKNITQTMRWNDQLLKALQGKVLSKDETQKLLGQKLQSRGEQLIKILLQKRNQHFIEFCHFLKQTGYKDLSQELTLSLQAKQGVNKQIQEDVGRIVSGTFLNTTVADPRQEEMQQKLQEFFQTKHFMWENYITEVEEKLLNLESNVKSISSEFFKVISEEPSDDTNEGSAVERVKLFSEHLSGLINRMREENGKLSSGASEMAREQEELRRHINVLERQRMRQRQELSVLQEKLAQTTQAMEELEKEYMEKDKEKSDVIAELKKQLEEHGGKMSNICASHTSHVTKLKTRLVKLEMETAEREGFLKQMAQQKEKNEESIKALELWHRKHQQDMELLEKKIKRVLTFLEVLEANKGLDSKTAQKVFERLFERKPHVCQVHGPRGHRH